MYTGNIHMQSYSFPSWFIWKTQKPTKQKPQQSINKLDTYGPLMALHVTIIILQIYMVIMVELNAEQKIQKQNNNNRAKTKQPSNQTSRTAFNWIFGLSSPPDTPILYF